MKHAWTIAAIALAACSQPQNAPEGAKSEAAVAAATSADGGERFYGQEKFTIVTRHSGAQTGTTTTHVRDWGRQWVEVNDTAITVMGVSTSTRNRVVHDGARVITIDANGNATAITNPLYDQVVAAMRGRSGVEFGKEIMTRMGGKPTGETGSFVGQACDYWELTQLGAKSCVAPWGATLHLKTALAGIAMEQTATEVRLGDGGPDAAFAYDASKVTEGPDLGDAMGKLKGL
jgi:hypothetical protein